jgi:MTH538 TIR-like domain (DUF1863)
MAGEYKYYAFISYSSVNRAWADWLRKRLETYRIPRRVEGFTGEEQPRRFHPIFQDREELRSSWSLSEVLKEALRKSRFLIVICSPEAAVSQWVNEEIRYFKSLGRQDRILALIVDGIPGAPAGDPTACFPPELRTLVEPDETLTESLRDTPAAADARQGGDGRKRALFRIIAGLLAVNVEAVVKREHRRQFTRRCWGAAALLLVFVAVLWAWGAAALLLLLATILWIWNYNRVRVSHYGSYIERWGIPQGIMPLTSEARSRRISYRFEHSRGKLRSLQQVDSNGLVTYTKIREDIEATQILFHYRDDGRLSEKVYSDRFDRTLLTEEFSADGTIITLRKENNLPAMVESRLSNESIFTGVGALDAEANPLRYNTRVARRQVEYDPTGLLVRQINQDVYGGPAVARDGTWGVAYRYDSFDYAIESTQLGPTGAPSVDNRGVAIVRWSYDTRRRLVETQFVDANEKPVLAEEGYARATFQYDELDRRIETKYFGISGDPMIVPAGYSSIHYGFDIKSNLVSVSFGDEIGHLVVQREGHALRRMDLNARGWIIRIRYFDADEQPCLNSSGYASILFERDENGNALSERYFGTNHEPVASGGVFEIYRRFDSRGQAIYTEFRDALRKRAAGIAGHAAVEETYDARDRLVEIRFLDAAGRLTVPNKGYGSAMRRRQYSEDGRSITETIFDAAGAPTPGEFGACEGRVTFSEFGTPEEVTSYDAEGVPTLNSFGFHKAIIRSDAAGRPAEWAWFGTQNERVIQRQARVHRFKETYNRLGLLVSEITYDLSNKPTPGKNGYAEFRAAYDARGWRIANDFFDAWGQPTVNTDGVASIRYSFDNRGNVVEQTNLGPDGKPTAQKAGFATERSLFDERNQLIDFRVFDTEGSRAVSSQGYHRIESHFDARGRIVEQTYFGVDDQRVFATFPLGQILGGDNTTFVNRVAYLSSIRLAYDATGRLLSLRAFGLRDEPVLGFAGAHMIGFSYSAKGLLNGFRFLDAQHVPIISLLGFAATETDYDERGQMVETRYFGSDGNLMLHFDPDYGNVYAAFRLTYDDHNRVETATFLDSDRKPFLSNLHASAMRKRYDAQGNEIEHQFLGLDGQLINSSLGCAIKKADYDAYGNVIRQSQYDAQGQIIPIAPKHFSTAYKNNFAGQTTEMTYFDREGGVGQSETGVARVEFDYDARGLEVEHRLFGPENNLVVGKYGYARCTVQYNEAGQLVRRTYYSSSDVIFINPLFGYAQETCQYDSLRRAIEWRYLDAEGGLINAKNGVALQLQTFSAGRAETIQYDAKGNQANGTEGWARRVYQDGVDGKPDQQLMFDSTGCALVGALLITECDPFGLAQKLELRAGDVVLRLGDWAAQDHANDTFQWRKLRFSIARVSSSHEELGAILREGELVRVVVPPGPLGVTGQRYLHVSDGFRSVGYCGLSAFA